MLLSENSPRNQTRHLREFAHLRYRRKRNIIRGDKVTITECEKLIIDTLKNYSPSQRSRRWPHGYMKFSQEKCAIQEGGLLRSRLPFTFEYTFENIMVCRTLWAKNEVFEKISAAPPEALRIITVLVDELLPLDFVRNCWNLADPQHIIGNLNYLSLRQLEDLRDLLKL